MTPDDQACECRACMHGCDSHVSIPTFSHFQTFPNPLPAGVNVAEAQRLAASGGHNAVAAPATNSQAEARSEQDVHDGVRASSGSRRASVSRKGFQRSLRSGSWSSLSDYNGQGQGPSQGQGPQRRMGPLKDNNGRHTGLATHICIFLCVHVWVSVSPASATGMGSDPKHFVSCDLWPCWQEGGREQPPEHQLVHCAFGGSPLLGQ